MIYNFLFLSVLSLFLVQGNGLDLNESLTRLKEMVDSAMKKADSVAASIDIVRRRYDDMVDEKLTCISDQYFIQMKNLNNTIIETTLKALSKDKQFPIFQCIATAGNEYQNALTATFSKIYTESDRVKDKGVASAKAYALLFPIFDDFIVDLFGGSAKALGKSKTEDEMEEVLNGVALKLGHLHLILEQIDKKLEELRFAFFNEYVDFVYSIDKSFRKSVNDGKTKVTACLRK